MDRYNAIKVTIGVGTLSLFTFIYTYYGTVRKDAQPGEIKSSSSKTESSLVITATHSTKPKKSKKSTKKKHNQQDVHNKNLVTVLKHHDHLLTENTALVSDLESLNPSDVIKKTYFVSTLNEKSFDTTKQKITFVKKEIGMLKKANSALKKEIKKLQRKK